MLSKPSTPNADDPWSTNFCRKGVPGCYCAVGYPYEKMCPDCRDGRKGCDVFSYCICPSSSERIPETGITYLTHGPSGTGPYCCLSKLTEPLIVKKDKVPDTVKILFDETCGEDAAAQKETYVRIRALPQDLQFLITRCLSMSL